jgi:hypothetical protein
MTIRTMLTRSEGLWWRVPCPGADAVRLGELIEGFAAIADVDETNRTVRLVRPLRFGDAETRIHEWATTHGYRVLPAVPAGIAARPRPVL